MYLHIFQYAVNIMAYPYLGTGAKHPNKYLNNNHGYVSPQWPKTQAQGFEISLNLFSFFLWFKLTVEQSSFDFVFFDQSHY